MAKRFKRRLDTPAKLIRIEGLDLIPLNPDGTVVYGTYVIRYIWSYDNITVVKPRTLVFSPPDNRIEFRKNGFTINKVEKINIISSQSTDPYHPTYFSTINTSLPSDITAHYVERDIDDNVTLDVDITNVVTINTTLVQSSVVSNKLPQGTYVFSYQAEYNNGSTTYTKSISREIVSTTYTTVPQQNPPLYTLVWENLPLPVINKDVGDAFPSLAEMTDIIPTAVITETATGNVTRFATTYLTPTEPAGGVTTSSTYLIKFMAVNLLSGSGGDTGFDDVTFNTYVVPQLKTRSIQYNIVTQNPQPVPIEITFSPATLDDVTFQDFESGSNPVPLSYNNGGLFPSEAQLLSGVTATYVDQDSIVQPLSITITRPTGSQYTNPLKDFFFDNGEVKMHIPRTWAVKYEATAPDGTYKSITRNIIIEDTIAPVFSPVVPTTMEKGTGYNTWLGRTFYGYDYPRYSNTYPAPRSGTNITVDKTQQEFNALDDGDTFTTTYTTIDNSGNARITAQVTTCQDTVSPTLEFNSTLTFPTGSNPTDEELKVGVETSDLSEPITLTVDDSGINYSVQGFYTASYTATDAYGNSRTRTRNVFVKGSGTTLTPPGSSPIACPTTPGVPNIYLDGTEVIANITDEQWIEGLYAKQSGENITYKIVVAQNSIDALPVTAAGTLDWDNNSDGWIDVEVTPLYINYEIQDEDGVPLICTTRYIETIDVLAPTIYNIPNPILVYKAPNDGFGQSSTTPNDVIADIVSQINVIDNVDGTGFTTATLEGITQVDINSGSDIVRTLRFTDSEGNESRYVTTIQFTDNAHPVITLLGDDPLILTSSVLPSDPGATATDLEDGTLPVTSYWNSIFPNGKAIYGTWNVKYTATDSAGVIVEEIREVQVPYFPPTITLLGNNPYSFTQNPGYQSDPLAEAYSVLDGNLTSQITSNWDDFINGSTLEGTYTITYSVTDSRGATVTATRTVSFTSYSCTIPGAELYFDGSSTSAQISSNSFFLGGATLSTSNGKYGSDSFDFEATGNKIPLTLSTPIDLSSGVYTFSLWFYNKRGGGNYGAVIRSPDADGAYYPILINNSNDHLGNYTPSGFQSTGYSMTQFETASAGWNHLAVVCNGTTSTYYVNGQQAGNVINRVITVQTSQFGSMASQTNQTFAEALDEITYWDSALTADDISCIYNSPVKAINLMRPTITLLGDNPYSFTENPGSQQDPNATAYSVVDGNLTSAITSNWSTYINGSTQEGTYTITYSVTDSNGLTVTATRIVNYNSCPYRTLPNLYFDGSTTAAINSTNNISLGGATLSTSNGKYGSDSFDFDTTGNKAPLTLSTPINLSSGVYTFSLWFYNKRTASTDQYSVLRAPYGSSNYPISIRYSDNNLGMFKNSSYKVTGFSMTPYNNLQQWTHLAVVATGSTSTYYINGQQAGNVVNDVVTANVQQIGSYDGDNAQTFAEALDEITYWNVALEPCEIEEIYSSSVSLYERNLVEYEDSRFITLSGDVSLNNGILEFDGTNGYAVYGHDYKYTDKYSAAVWFKVPNIGSENIILSCHDGGNAANGWNIGLQANGTLNIRWLDSNTGLTGVDQNVGSNLDDDQWHHIVVTWEDVATNNRKIYLDGQLVRTTNRSSGPKVYFSNTSPSPGSGFYLGAQYNYAGGSQGMNHHLLGSLDDFRLVRKVMDSTEVADLYNNTSGSH